MNGLVDWRDPDFEQLPVGGKARALGRLSKAGFTVPDWYVVLPGVSLNANELIASIATHFKPGTLFAVRSSALDEDGAKHSFAGQLESHLNVELAELIQKIDAVRKSGFSERIITYRRQAGLPLPPPEPAVILQSMVPAQAAGVAFSADPVGGRRGIAVVASVIGLADALVSGEREGDHFEIDRSGVVIMRKLEDETRPSISDKQASEIVNLARRCEDFFGQPQDIEWAIHENQSFLLQSRPITSLASIPDPEGAYQLWDNSNIAESYNGVTTPLTFSFALHIYDEVYRQFVKILRVPASRVEAKREVFARMLGLIRGRIYYNLLNWYRVLAMLPGFAINRKFMEQMMGVKEGLPHEMAAEIESSKTGSKFKDWVELFGTITGLFWSHQKLPQGIRAFYRRLDATLKPCEIPLERMRPDELAAEFRRMQRELLTRWDAPLANDFFAMIYYGLLRQLCVNWCGDTHGTLQNDLISNQGGMISAEPAHRVQKIAALSRPHAKLVDALQKQELAEILKLLTDFPEIKTLYHAYLEKFGDRCLEELKLESATLHDDPLTLLRAIGRLAAQPEIVRQVSKPDETSSIRAERKVKVKLKGHPIREILFNFVLSHARARVRDRENLRFERTRVFGRVRRIFVELGKRFFALGLLEAPRDIFFLTYEEVLGYVEGTAVTASLRCLTALRKSEFDTYRTHAPSDRFETRGLVYVGNTFVNAKTVGKDNATGSTFRGTGCCPGVMRARCRVILDPRNAVLEPGEILVAPRTDPGWILLFPAASGLLVEHGSLLSHSAIVAREMGIPAIVSLPGLVHRVQTGDELEMDGASGIVTRLNSESV